MLPQLLISPHADFWRIVARQIGIGQQASGKQQIMVPTFAHAQCLKQALMAASDAPRLLPPIHTLDAWLALQCALDLPASSQRLMNLFAELRQHTWLKHLFGSSDALDLLPLANTLLTLFDELSAALLPGAGLAHDASADRWQQALAQLSVPARQLLSEEAQLVWTLWQAQLDADDPAHLRHAALLRLAAQAPCPLLWIHPVAPDPMQLSFLQAWARQQSVRVLALDWRAAALHPLVARAWPELLQDAGPEGGGSAPSAGDEDSTQLQLPALCPASSLEQEAQRGALCILQWLAAGHTRLALVAQDRVVARRIRALLERAQVLVSDETGWKLSTTRAAAALAAWFEVLASSADVIALLDLFKSPFVYSHWSGKAEWLMQLEMILRRQNVSGGWKAVLAALPARFYNKPLLEAQTLAQQFGGRKTLAQWFELNNQVLDQLGLKAALAQDLAGQQVLALLADIANANQDSPAHFHFAEWQACVSLEMEARPFVSENSDQRVVMLPLNGARLRRFDAVLMVGCDAAGLPSQAPEILFFANAVRRELGLATREQRQQQQLRDFCEIVVSGAQLVLSWQQFKNGEPNACCPWIERLQLVLERAGLPALDTLQFALPVQRLQQQLALPPQPSAPALLPAKLSASGYQSFMACPYAFFARQMLRLSQDDMFSDLPEKRDYGDWLHGILHHYHEQLLLDPQQPHAALLQTISSQKFEQELQRGAGALGYYVRWQQTMPGYLEWAEQQAENYTYLAGEQARERVLQWPGGQIVLHGRLDRIDQDQQGQQIIIDYKTGALSSLQAKIEGEDQQLAFYGLLDTQASQAVFLSLDKKKIALVSADDLPQRTQKLEQHILHSMQALQAGAVLPANGNASACQYCEMAGLCRKGGWA